MGCTQGKSPGAKRSSRNPKQNEGNRSGSELNKKTNSVKQASNSVIQEESASQQMSRTLTATNKKSKHLHMDQQSPENVEDQTNRLKESKVENVNRDSKLNREEQQNVQRQRGIQGQERKSIDQNGKLNLSKHEISHQELMNKSQQKKENVSAFKELGEQRPQGPKEHTQEPSNIQAPVARNLGNLGVQSKIRDRNASKKSQTSNVTDHYLPKQANVLNSTVDHPKHRTSKIISNGVFELEEGRHNVSEKLIQSNHKAKKSQKAGSQVQGTLKVVFDGERQGKHSQIDADRQRKSMKSQIFKGERNEESQSNSKLYKTQHQSMKVKQASSNLYIQPYKKPKRNGSDQQKENISQIDEEGEIKIPLQNEYKSNSKHQIQSQSQIRILDKYMQGLEQKVVEDQAQAQNELEAQVNNRRLMGLTSKVDPNKECAGNGLNSQNKASSVTGSYETAHFRMVDGRGQSNFEGSQELKTIKEDNSMYHSRQEQQKLPIQQSKNSNSKQFKKPVGPIAFSDIQNSDYVPDENSQSYGLQVSVNLNLTESQY